MAVLRTLIGQALRATRLRQDRTLREVSAAARVSLGYLSEVERGQKEASSELLASICRALGVRLSDVLREVSESLSAVEPEPVPVPAGVPVGVAAGVGGPAHEPPLDAGAASNRPVAVAGPLRTAAPLAPAAPLVAAAPPIAVPDPVEPAAAGADVAALPVPTARLRDVVAA